MGLFKLFLAPIRGVLRFPLFQLLLVIAIILWLQAADEASTRGQVFARLDSIVDSTVHLSSSVFTVKSFTKAWLVSGYMIAYVYLAALLALFLLRLVIGWMVDCAGRWNFFWLRTVIARERGIRAYCAWLPFERIRPEHVSQRDWEEKFAWPSNNKPPYPPFIQRLMLGAAVYAAFLAAAWIILELFAPSVLTWFAHLIGMRWE